MFRKLRNKLEDTKEDMLDKVHETRENVENVNVKRGLSWGWKIVLALVVLYVLYIPYGMWTSDSTDVYLEQQVTVEKGQSRAVAMAIKIMEEQLANDWVPNNPSWQPSSWLDNTPSFQKGVLKVQTQFAYGMALYAGRTRSSSSMDVDLDKAMGRLQYAPDVWMFDPSVSMIGIATTSEEQYAKALEFYKSYQSRLARGAAVFDIRADSLIAILSQFSNNMGSLAANIEQHIDDNPNGLLDAAVDNKYYFNKGQAYAYYMILRELGEDFKAVIIEKKQEQIWQQMLDSLRIVAELEPLLIFNGDQDTMFLNSHLANQGFQVLLADRRMKEVMDGLLK